MTHRGTTSMTSFFTCWSTGCKRLFDCHDDIRCIFCDLFPQLDPEVVSKDQILQRAVGASALKICHDGAILHSCESTTDQFVLTHSPQERTIWSQMCGSHGMTTSSCSHSQSINILLSFFVKYENLYCFVSKKLLQMSMFYRKEEAIRVAVQLLSRRLLMVALEHAHS